MSNALKTRLKDISNSSNYDNRYFVFDATVLAINEKANTCDISYKDKNGYWSTEKNVAVKFEPNGVIGWFPNVGDSVIVSANNGYLEITGINTKDLKSARVKTNVTKDILSNFYDYVIGGHIF